MRKAGIKGKFVAGILSAILAACCLSACADSPLENEIEVWSTYNTLKVMQDYGDYPDLGAKINVSLAMGETEGGQIIITPKLDVSSYSLEIGELSDTNGNVFPAKNINIYVQKYIEIKAKTTDQKNYDYPPGYVPDLLLPIDVAEQFGETAIEGGKNQGITVEFTAEDAETTPAGVYVGTAELVVDGEKFTLPVSVQVWDFDVSRSYNMTSVRAWGEQFYEGELENTPELYENYYETMLNDYKFCYEDLPGSSDPKTMAESVLKYWDNPNFTSYNIPSYPRLNNTIDNALFMPYLRELALHSEPDKILFDKAHIYPNFLDEPNQLMYDAVVDSTNAIYDMKEELYAELSESGYFDEYPDEYRDEFYRSLTNVPIIITASNTKIRADLEDKVNTYCVVIDQLDTETARDQHTALRELTKDKGGQLWYYTCVQPLYPYPSHHLDDYLIGSRIMRWMEKYYDLDGYLYWSVNTYTKYDSALGKVYVDPYKTALRFGTGEQGVMGDGFMVYPKAFYNTDQPLGSLRLVALRDGQEDLNALFELEKLYREAELYYGLETGTVAMNDALEEMFESMFSGTVYNPDDAVFYAARNRVAENISRLKSDAGLLFDRTITGDVIRADFYLHSGYELKVNGEMIVSSGESKNGQKFTVSKELSDALDFEVEVIKDGKTVEKYTFTGAGRTSLLDLSADGEFIEVSESCTKTDTEAGLKVDLVPKGDTLNEKLTYRPSVSFEKSGFGVSFDKLGDVSLILENTGDTDLILRVRVVQGRSGYILKDNIVITAGERKEILLKNVGKTSYALLAQATHFEISTKNIDSENALLPPGELLIKQISYETI